MARHFPCVIVPLGVIKELVIELARMAKAAV
jgi:hypothetical protein